jgi:hypothetical protein
VDGPGHPLAVARRAPPVRPDAVRLSHRSPEDVDRSTQSWVGDLVKHPPDALRAVMNHEAGPLDAGTIRAACGQVVERARPVP